MVLIDQRNQRRHLSDSFRPDPTSSSFQKPVSPMNVASGCPLFVAHRVLEGDDTYLRDDAMYIKIYVEPTDAHTWRCGERWSGRYFGGEEDEVMNKMKMKEI